jgi:urate oxidase
MSVRIECTNYGKSMVRLLKVRRNPGRHEVHEWTVAVRFDGPYEAAHRKGDNADVLPTDTMKNTVYAKAADTAAATPESFALELARFFHSRSTVASSVEIAVSERTWTRMTPGGAPHEHAFVAAGGDTREARVRVDAGGASLEGGLENLLVMKTTKSAFAGFPRDEFTTLPETHDRILRTIVCARWRWAGEDAAAADRFGEVRRLLLDTFADHDSRSVQETLFAMGRAVLDGVPEVLDIRLSLPNRHCLPMDLTRFGLENRNCIFVVTDEPFGLIEATLTRD